jgi:hypothetical protein
MALSNAAPLQLLYEISHWFCASLHINLLASQLPAVVSKLGHANVDASYEPHQAIRLRIWPNAVGIPEHVDAIVQQKLCSAHTSTRLASPSPQIRPAQSSAPPAASRAALALSNRPATRTAAESSAFFLHLALDARRKLAVSSNPALVLPASVAGAEGPCTAESVESSSGAQSIPLELVTRACGAATLPFIVTWALSAFATQRCRQIFNFLSNFAEPSVCTRCALLISVFCADSC